MVRQLSNDELFKKYEPELKLRIHNQLNLKNDSALLDKFREFLGDAKPSPTLAKEFISLYHDRSRNTQVRYAATIKSFMRYYREPIVDLKIKRPMQLPQYVEDDQIEKLLAAAREKRSHKGTIQRDLLIIELYLKTGMRRSELAELKVRDVHRDFIMVISGKGERDRMIPLLPDIADRLNGYIRNKQPDEIVFGLVGPSIGNKISVFARKAGLKDIHTHSLRHKYATDLLESGANIRAVQLLLGHSNLATTQVYLGITEESLREAVNGLDKKGGKGSVNVGKPDNVYQTSTELSLDPPILTPERPFEPDASSANFTLKLASASILIESLQVRTSEPKVPFKLMLFESDPGKISGNVENEDIIQMNPVTQRILNYSAGKRMPYINKDGQGELYGAIYLHMRPLMMKVSPKGGGLITQYKNRPVIFIINLRYQLT
ncbi:tyrosine-type recombinase/integrase [Chloroflexota bacterium]